MSELADDPSQSLIPDDIQHLSSAERKVVDKTTIVIVRSYVDLHHVKLQETTNTLVQVKM